MTAPDRIWVQWPHANGAGLAFICQARPPALRQEYIRADLATPAAMTPEVRALVEAAKEVGRISDRDHVAWRRLADALAALRAGGDG